MSADFIEINLKNVLNFKKCGEILISEDQFQFAIVCKFCERIFNHGEGFMRHIRDGDHAKELCIQETRYATDIYSIEELMDENIFQYVEPVKSDHDCNKVDIMEDGNNTQCFRYQEELIKIDDLLLNTFQNGDDSAIASLEEHHIQADLQEDVVVANTDEDYIDVEFLVEEKCDAQDDSVIVSVEDFIPNDESLTSLLGDRNEITCDGNDNIIKEIDKLLAAESFESITLDLRQSKKISENQLECKEKKTENLMKFYDDSAEANKENTPPKVLAGLQCAMNFAEVDCRMESRSKSQHIANQKFLKNDRPRLIRVPSEPLQKRSEQPPIASSRLIKRKTSNTDESVDASIMKRTCNDVHSILNNKTPALSKSENLVDQQYESFQKGEVLARMSKIKKRIYQSLRSNNDTYKNVDSNSKIQIKNNSNSSEVNIPNTTKNVANSFCVQSSQVCTSAPTLNSIRHSVSSEVNEEQSTLDLSRDTDNMDYIQLDEHELASASNMEGISLLDASAVSLPEQMDLDTSLSVFNTPKTQKISSHFASGNIELLAKVGLHCIHVPTLDNTLTLAEEDVVHARARVFAEALRKYNSIWCYTINANREEEFRALAVYLNDQLHINLSTYDLKVVINELFQWYNTLHQEKLIKKKSPAKCLRYYLQLFAFLPKMVRFTLYCEYCVSYFRLKRDYVQHKQQQHINPGNANETLLIKSPLFKSPMERVNICAVCHVEYATAELLYEHSKTHLVHIFECGQCARVFATNNDLQRHTQLCHQ